MPELTLWWSYSLKSWLFANQYFSGIQYMWSIPSQEIQTVTHSALHNILSFRLLCHLVDSKTVPYLPRFSELTPLSNRPFRSVHALKASTGPTIPGHLPRPPPTLHRSQDSTEVPHGCQSLGAMTARSGACRESASFLQSKWNCFCGRNGKESSFQKRGALGEHETCFHKCHGELSLSSSAGTRNQIQTRRW